MKHLAAVFIFIALASMARSEDRMPWEQLPTVVEIPSFQERIKQQFERGKTPRNRSFFGGNFAPPVSDSRLQQQTFLETLRKPSAPKLSFFDKKFVALASDASQCPLFARIKANFPKWDTNLDGRLTMDEINQHMTDHSIKGEDAAALAALKAIQRRGSCRAVFGGESPFSDSNPEFTIESLQQMTGEQWQFANNAYNEGLQKIQAEAGCLYTSSSLHLYSVRQGRLADCSFLAVIGGMIDRDADQIRKMIQKYGQGEYLVTFPNGARAVVWPTQAELALNSEANGEWLAVLEIACGYISPEAPGVALAQRTDEPTDVIAYGNEASAVMMLLTGDASTHTQKLHDTTAAVLLELDRKLKLAADKNMLVVAVTSSDATPSGISENHAYSLLSYDPNLRRVLLWNSGGFDFTPQGQAGLTNGYAIVNGEFWIPLEDFARVFDKAVLQTGY